MSPVNSATPTYSHRRTIDGITFTCFAITPDAEKGKRFMAFCKYTFRRARRIIAKDGTHQIFIPQDLHIEYLEKKSKERFEPQPRISVREFEELIKARSADPGKVIYSANFLKCEADAIAEYSRLLVTGKADTQKIHEALADALFYLTRCAIDTGSSLQILMDGLQAKFSQKADYFKM